MTRHRILGISGALRRDATNRKLIREAARLYGNVDFTEADLNLPLYNGDLEDATGIPPVVQTLADQIALAANRKTDTMGRDREPLGQSTQLCPPSPM